VQRPSGVPRSTLEFRLVLDAAEPGGIELPDPDADGKVLALSPQTVATQSDIAKTAVIQSATPEYFGVYVYFTSEAAQRMREVSRDNVGHRMAIVLNGQVFMAPYMQSMFDSPVLIQGSYTREQATHLAEQLAP
jgi:preprotein translocase subunit SecD